MAKFSAQAVIFDLDNTLYDEKQYFSLAFEKIARHLAPICETEWIDVYQQLQDMLVERGSKYPRFLQVALADLGVYSSQLDQEVFELYQTVAGDLSLHSDAAELLGHLKGKVKLGIITNGVVRAQANKVKLLGIGPYFDHVCYARTFGAENEKPSLIPYHHTLAEMGADPQFTLYVGDDPVTDINGARAAGVFMVRLRRGEWAEVDSPATSLPDLEIRSLDEIPHHISFDGAGT